MLIYPAGVQDLRVFLEGDGVLALCPEWQRLQPANGTLLDGVARLPKQLLGKCPAVMPGASCLQCESQAATACSRPAVHGFSRQRCPT